ncbi:unnamed protein product [Allacma fusca]|uniref:Uncharacterized protein n=1 Tax=Allacma fusca TaxID=39272 RepID=A0A8J2PYJ3_9HEXA|nr:unnamed protein product [Allacma fusca]
MRSSEDASVAYYSAMAFIISLISCSPLRNPLCGVAKISSLTWHPEFLQQVDNFFCDRADLLSSSLSFVLEQSKVQGFVQRQVTARRVNSLCPLGIPDPCSLPCNDNGRATIKTIWEDEKLNMVVITVEIKKSVMKMRFFPPLWRKTKEGKEKRKTGMWVKPQGEFGFDICPSVPSDLGDYESG